MTEDERWNYHFLIPSFDAYEHSYGTELIHFSVERKCLIVKVQGREIRGYYSNTEYLTAPFYREGPGTVFREMFKDGLLSKDEYTLLLLKHGRK
jgi:hypothetical protein